MTLAHDDHAVGQAEQLRHVGGDHDDGLSFLRKLRHELVNFALRADINAARRLVEDQHVAVAQEPFGNDDLLLVAAGEAADAGADGRRFCADLLGMLLRKLVHFSVMDEGALEDLLQTGQDGVVRDGQVEAQAVALAVLGEIADAVVDGVLRAVDLHVLSVYPDRAGVHRIRAADQAHGLGAARADKTGEAEDLALAELEGNVLDIEGVQVLGLEHDGRVGRAHGLCFRFLIDRAADHEADDLGDLRRGGVERSDVLAVAHDGDAVGDAFELIHAVRDIDDADAGLLELADKDEQVVDLRVGQDGGGLVEDEQSCVFMGQSLCDFDHLLLRDRQRLDDGLRIEIQMQLVEQRLRHGVLLCLVDEQALHGLAADIDVFRHGQVLHEVQLLVDDADAERLRVARAVDLDMLSKKFDRAAVARVDAGQHLHERRFTGTVFADQRHDLALANLQLRVVQRVDAREVFLDTGHSENRFGHLSFTFPFLLRRVSCLWETKRFAFAARKPVSAPGGALLLREPGGRLPSLPPRAALLPYSSYCSRPTPERA